MTELYRKRMARVLSGRVNNDASDYFRRQSAELVEQTFAHDPNAFHGNIYDWDLEPIEDIEFKFQKVKERNPERKAVEYYVQFRPYRMPEQEFADRYYKQDGRERLGFYLDIPDFERQTVDKWLIVNKEIKTNFSRYMVFKCNWQLEWVKDGKYYSTLGVLRDSLDNNLNLPLASRLGGSELDGEASFILPSNPTTRTITPGTRLMITDNDLHPTVYEVNYIKDTEPMGLVKLYLKRQLLNRHTDAWGNVNSLPKNNFLISLPVPDLMDGFGGSYHYICDCLVSSEEKPTATETFDLKASNTFVRLKGNPLTVQATGIENPVFHIYIEDHEYSPSELSDYFEIEINDKVLTLKAINRVMVGYHIRFDVINGIRTKSVEVEVIQ